MLPECPAQPWVAATWGLPARRQPAGGPRESRQAAAAQAAEIALLGGSIEQTEDGGRLNTAVFWDNHGHEQLRYSKMHIPDEPGFEKPPTTPSTNAVQCVEYHGWRIGVQICSDNQPHRVPNVVAQGCDLILNPRATERTFLET